LFAFLLCHHHPPFLTFPVGSHKATNPLKNTEVIETVASTTTICASSLENQQHHAVDWPMPGLTVVLTSPTCHLGGGAWVHAPPFMVDFVVFKPAKCKLAGFKVRGRRRRSKTSFAGGA